MVLFSDRYHRLYECVIFIDKFVVQLDCERKKTNPSDTRCIWENLEQGIKVVDKTWPADGTWP